MSSRKRQHVVVRQGAGIGSSKKKLVYDITSDSVPDTQDVNDFEDGQGHEAAEDEVSSQSSQAHKRSLEDLDLDYLKELSSEQGKLQFAK